MSFCLSLGAALATTPEAHAADPSLQWSTYYGGSSPDSADDVAFDSTDAIVMVGDTRSNAGIAGSTLAFTAFDSSYNGGASGDGFVAKFNMAGSRQWGTYYGGAGSDSFSKLAIGSGDRVIAVGMTESASGISTVGAALNGVRDGMIVAFNSGGSRAWARYIGGNGSDYAKGVCVGSTGTIYVVGSTTSTSGLALSAPQQGTRLGTTDAFIAKISSAGSPLWIRYFGDASGVTDAVDCAVDSSHNIYVTGETTASAGIGLNGWDHSYAGSTDAFVAKFSTNGIRQWSSYYGGPGLDRAQAIDVDADANVYIAGMTMSANNLDDFISTDSTELTGDQDGFVARFDADTAARSWGTYFGGEDQNHGGGDQFYDLDVQGSVLYLSGTTDSDGNATPDAFNTSYSDWGDAILVTMDKEDGDVQYATYIAGTGESGDWGRGVAANIANAAVAGSTTGQEFATPGAWDETYNTGVDPFLLLIQMVTPG